jgi:hypothetical protein
MRFSQRFVIISAVILTIILPLKATKPDKTLPLGTTVTIDSQPETPGVQSWSVSSAYQNGTNKIEYILPTNAEKGKLYPVVYILPVNAGTKGDWGHPLEVALKHDLATKFQAIIVCPAYNALPWFGDNPNDSKFRQSSYFTDVVIPLVESRLPALAEPRGRFLVGFSKSAHGVLGIFLRNTSQFAKIALFENYWGRPSTEQWENWGFASCYGTRQNYDAWDPQLLIDLHKNELIGGSTRIIVLSGGPKIRLGVQALVDQLRLRQIPIQYNVDDNWIHNWTCGWLPVAISSLLY